MVWGETFYDKNQWCSVLFGDYEQWWVRIPFDDDKH
jgi:hypothetical protein